MRLSPRPFRLAAVLILFGCAVNGAAAFADECKPLTEPTKKMLVVYLSKRLKISDAASLTVGKEEWVRGTCYRKLTLEGGSLTQPLTFVLAPDQRFVSPLVLDTTFDPDLEKQEEAERINKLLIAEDSPSRGDFNAPISIVEFSDFECPYCRRFNDWMQTLPEDTKARIRLVYKHFPLSIHPWANDAAALATCASLQSSSAFWLLHDFIFKEQASLNSTNTRQHVREFAANTPQIDAQQLLACFDKHKADEIIARDRELAGQLHVTSTPTIFVNGERVGPLQSTSDLQAVIAEAYAAQKSSSRNR